MTAEGDQSGKSAQSERVRRPQRVAGKTFSTETTVFTDGSRQFGEVLLRKDHDVALNLTPAEKVAFIRTCVRYARIYGRIDILEAQLAEAEKIIRAMTDEHEGLRGIESTRLGKSVTDVPEIKISPDVVRVRKATGSAFPQFGTEQVVATITVPEEVQSSGETITGDRITDVLRLGLLFTGMDTDTVTTNASFKKAMHVTDREALFTAVNNGLVPENALGAKRSKKVEVKPLTKSSKAK